MDIREEVQQVLAENHRDRQWWIHFHAKWLADKGIIEVRSSPGSPPD